MDKNFVIQLTSNLYRVTLLFPKKEPFRLKMRELATEILEDSVKLKSSNPSTKIIPEILEHIEVLDNFFEVARNQNWTSPQDVLKLKQEYSMLRGELEKVLSSQKLPEERLNEIREKESGFRAGDRRFTSKISTRQQKILEILKEKKRSQVKDLKNIFPEMSKRTLRRDFEKLLNQGLVERIGEKQDTFYLLKAGLRPK